MTTTAWCPKCLAERKPGIDTHCGETSFYLCKVCNVGCSIVTMDELVMRKYRSNGRSAYGEPQERAAEAQMELDDGG